MSLFPEHLTDRYRRFKFRHFPLLMDYYGRLASDGQSPDVMVVSCSDSRVDPEIIFCAKPGELFVVRNVANLVPPYETGGEFHGVSAALEFAVLNLRVRHIVVMGHSGCGGVKAVLAQESALETDARFISKWMSLLDNARAKVLLNFQGVKFPDMVASLEREGVKASLANLRTFPFVAEAERRGHLSLHGAYFHIGTGALFALNERTGEYYSLE